MIAQRDLPRAYREVEEALRRTERSIAEEQERRAHLVRRLAAMKAALGRFVDDGEPVKLLNCGARDGRYLLVERLDGGVIRARLVASFDARGDQEIEVP